MQTRTTPIEMTAYRASDSEVARIQNLMDLLPDTVGSVLDIGARDGFVSKRMADRCATVVALDLELPVIDDERIQCVQGNITKLAFADSSFDAVLCAEVLEHIPADMLQTACNELGRVTKEYLLIGVPYKQDIRLGRTTCQGCGKVNPPYGHINSFDEIVLNRLFNGFTAVRTSFVGETTARTNFMSAALMNIAGNPFGTYSQDEPCIHCNASLGTPPARNIWQKIATRMAFWGNRIQQIQDTKHANWIHLLMKKTSLG